MSMEMDKGSFIKNGYTVEPGDGGSFVVIQGTERGRTGLLSATRGFTNHIDLLRWLSEEHAVNAASGVAGQVDKRFTLGLKAEDFDAVYGSRDVR